MSRRSLLAWVSLVCVSACSSVDTAGGRETSAVRICAAVTGAPTDADRDGDGIDDARELDLARDYFPYFSLSGRDACPRHSVLFRARPHPHDPGKVALWYVVIYERDCGMRGHLGDNETFGELIDPAIAAPAGILGLRAISHQGTLCENVTTCGKLAGMRPCKTAKRNGLDYPVVFSSVNKHGTYVDQRTCAWSFLCDAGGCPLSAQADVPRLANAGEPGFALTRNLTESGLITPSNGWTERELFDFDPWREARFGKAGSVKGDLEDDAFLIPLARRSD